MVVVIIASFFLILAGHIAREYWPFLNTEYVLEECNSNEEDDKEEQEQVF